LTADANRGPPFGAWSVLETRDELFSTNEQLAMAGFLAGYGGLTRDADTLDLRQYVAWCTEHRLAVFGACRADIECFARHLESRGRARATIPRRLCTVARFYRYAEQEGLIANSPAAHVPRPRLDYESHATGLDRNEVGAMLVAAGLAGARDHALISRLALNGLRVSEAIGADIGDLGLERGHRTLTILRKGGKVVTIPLAPRTARAIDLAVGERCEGPIFIGANGEGIDRHAAVRIVRRIARRAGIAKRVGPYAPSRVHHRRARRWRSGSATSKGPPVTRTPERRCATTGPGSRSTVTPPTSWPRSSPAPAADTTCPLWPASSLQSSRAIWVAGA
jgi:site-specific recombinase XerD